MTTTICVKRDLVDSIQGPELPVEIRNGKVVVKLPDGLDLTLQGSLPYGIDRKPLTFLIADADSGPTRGT